ncbi:MAG: acetoacetate--CoA ligase, partial [Paucimonas sp.]|nr:acetoacetate--CoA ligase [Paucimonas sp.]
MSDPSPALWTPTPERIEQSRLTDYLRWLAREKGLHFDDYDGLWNWSVTQLEAFWQSIWHYFGVKGSQPATQVLDAHKMPGAKWFDGARLNFAEQLFRFHLGEQGERPAIIARSELRGTQVLSWSALREQVSQAAAGLRALGVGPGDRVVAYLPNIPETAIAFYACASIGAIWSSCSPDMGTASVLDRFRQIDPKVLLTVDGYRYGGRDFDRMDVVRTMREALPTLQHTVLLPYLDAGAGAGLEGALSWESLLTHPAAEAQPMRFEQLPFDHPLWILYSSGTTGMPKPIVHGHGGALIEGIKGHALHLDLGP